MSINLLFLRCGTVQAWILLPFHFFFYSIRYCDNYLFGFGSLIINTLGYFFHFFFFYSIRYCDNYLFGFGSLIINSITQNQILLIDDARLFLFFHLYDSMCKVSRHRIAIRSFLPSQPGEKFLPARGFILDQKSPILDRFPWRPRNLRDIALFLHDYVWTLLFLFNQWEKNASLRNIIFPFEISI